MGPAALRLAGLVDTLKALGLDVRDVGDSVAPTESTDDDGIRNFRPLVECITSLRSMVYRSLSEGHVPIVMGGEHTLVAAGISAALELFGGDLGLLWIDAHADIHTPGSSATGNVHGMPVAALAGMASDTIGKKDEEWRLLLGSLGTGPKLDLHKTAWYGLRDVDTPERSRLVGLPVSMNKIDRLGIEPTATSLDRWFRQQGVRNLWISFDVDVLDPILAPGTGTAVRGGLTYREAHLLAELIREALDSADRPYRLVGVDLVETNPLYDTHNQTALMAVEWLASLFGKTIL